jgi:hypothetical protein
MADPRIVVAYHSTGMGPTYFATDLARAMRYSGTMIPFALHEASCYVDSARNKLVKTFLQTEGTHLMMIDVDISFDPSAFLTTYEILHSQQAEVCYGNYCLGNGGNSIFGPPENVSKEAAVLVKLEPNVVYTDISTGGTGWLMVTRHLLQRMEKECPGPWHWFARDPTTDGADLRGEDVSFGLRVWNMKPRPKVIGTTSLFLRHLKTMPFIPACMEQEAKRRGLPAYSAPNPYEDETQYYINGHQIIEKKSLTPEAKAEIEARLKEAKDAKLQRETKKDDGSGPGPGKDGEENPDGNEQGAASGVRSEAPKEEVPPAQPAD